MCVCVCVSLREGEHVCVCVSEFEGGRAYVCVCVCVSLRGGRAYKGSCNMLVSWVALIIGLAKISYMYQQICIGNHGKRA